MSEAGTDARDESLAKLIAQEQRGFRGILYAGLTVLLVMLLMSGALGAYLYIASQRLASVTDTLQRQSFETRRRIDAQNNRIVAQEIALRHTYEEILRGRGARGVPPEERAAEAIEAAHAFLLRGSTPSLAAERWMRNGVEGVEFSPESTALLSGVAALIDYQSWRGQAVDDPANLPAGLTFALAQFEIARADATHAPAANAGIAWVRFAAASSANYTPDGCKQVFDAADASRSDGTPAPQPLYWRAQCERKLGLAREALSDYARALRASEQTAAAGAAPDPAELTLAMNAFHGVGTTMIAGYDIAETEDGMSDALAIAREACANGEASAYPDRSPRMQLALACLDKAIALRRELGQTDNQLSGTAENKSFAHLRDGDNMAAFQNTVDVEKTGIFAWTEAVRALTGSRVRGERPGAGAAAAEARRNVSMFPVGQFNVCELQALFSPQDYEDVIQIIADAHPGETVACAPKS